MIIRFGIIGLGNIAGRFAKVLNTVEGAELVAVASRDHIKAVEFAKSYGAKKAYSNYTDLIADAEVDVIYIALTHNFHYDIAKQCLNNYKAVLCEKPLVTNKEDAEELAALSKKNHTLLMEAMWTRCIPTFLKAKEWVQNGEIGQVKLVQASFCFNLPFNPEHRLFNPDLAGGSLYDAGVYPIEFTTGILGENPEEVKGQAMFCATGVDEFVAMSMRFAGGALASLSCGISAATKMDAYIYGTNGYIVVYDFLGSRKCELYDTNHNLRDHFIAVFEDGFIYQIQHFMELYRTNKIESDIIPHRDSVACAGVFDELLRQWGKIN